MRTNAYFDYVATSMGGSAQPNANAQVLASATIIVPDKSVLGRFAEILKPADRKLISNNQQSRTLSALRDALLPKLLSGEMRVKDIERNLGAVTLLAS